MNKIIKVTLAGIMSASLTACARYESATDQLEVCRSSAEARELSGINELAYPAHIDGYNAPSFWAVKNQMIQIIYSKDDGNKITIRKSNTGEEDISGDDTVYGSLETYRFLNDEGGQECLVTMQGHDTDRLCKATWSYDGYSYSIVASGDGYDDMPKLVEQSSTLGELYSTRETTTITNPFTDCETLEEAQARTGFDLTLPDSIDGYDEPKFQVMEGKMIQALYYSDDAEICIRKSNVEDKDISGDYNDYTWETSYSLMNSEWEDYEDEECTVTLKGYEDEYRTDCETVHKATWSHHGYSYSITSTEGFQGENSGIAEMIASIE